MTLRGFAAGALAALAAAQPANTYVVDDKVQGGKRFDGVGAISGGGATSRLLTSYSDDLREQIFDYLFAPSFGASLHILKVEIGGEALSTEGSEPTHMRYPNETNFYRGYEWMVMHAARDRNPDITLYGLPWTWPGWVGAGSTNQPWNNVSLPVQYTLEWVKGAEAVQGLAPINVLGIWNERTYSADYVKALRSALDDANLTHVAILCDDGHYYCVNDMLTDPELEAAVTYVGGHSPPPPNAIDTGKPLWFAEDFHSSGSDFGGAVWANQINRRWIMYNMTSTIAWNAVDAFYPGLSFDDTGFINARSPWSGYYQITAPIWASAHTTQFTQPGWMYCANNSGSGLLKLGGSYVTYTNTTSRDFTIVVEKFHNDGDPVCQPETVTFALGGNLAGAATHVQVWRSAFALSNGETADYFSFVGTMPVVNNTVTITVPVDTLWTISTITTASHGSHPPPPPDAPFPTTYSDDFESCAPPAEADYWSDFSGSWECVATGDAMHGTVMQMMTPSHPVSWEFDYRPHSVLGNGSWANVNFTVDVRLPDAGSLALVGARVSLLNLTARNALMAEEWTPGLWFAYNASGAWSLYPFIANVTVPGQSIASGTLPAAPGTSWHTVYLSTHDDAFDVAFDGTPVLTGFDVSALPYTGWVGIGTGDYGQFVQFDNMAVVAEAPTGGRTVDTTTARRASA